MGAPMEKEGRKEKDRKGEPNELKFRLNDRHPLVSVARRNERGVTSFFRTTLCMSSKGLLRLEMTDVIDCKCTRRKKRNGGVSLTFYRACVIAC